jgi:hypothetical protein
MQWKQSRKARGDPRAEKFWRNGSRTCSEVALQDSLVLHYHDYAGSRSLKFSMHTWLRRNAVAPDVSEFGCREVGYNM